VDFSLGVGQLESEFKFKLSENSFFPQPLIVPENESLTPGEIHRCSLQKIPYPPIPFADQPPCRLCHIFNIVENKEAGREYFAHSPQGERTAVGQGGGGGVHCVSSTGLTPGKSELCECAFVV